MDTGDEYISIILTSDWVRMYVIRWRCPKKACRKKRSIRHGSWFSHHRLTLKQILTISFLWSANVESHMITSWAEVDRNTTVDWCHFLHEVRQ